MLANCIKQRCFLEWILSKLYVLFELKVLEMNQLKMLRKMRLAFLVAFFRQQQHEELESEIMSWLQLDNKKDGKSET